VGPVNIEKSIGMTCAEDVVPYPPGIPLIAKGEVIQKEHIDYLLAIKKLKGLISLVMNDDNIKTILVVKQYSIQMKTISQTVKIPNYLKSAMRFDKTYLDIPVKESKEKLVSINDLFKKEKLTVFFSKDKRGDKIKIYVIREGLTKPLINVVKELNKLGLTLRFEYAYRTVEGQKKIYLEMIKRIENEYPKADRDTQLRIAGIYAAWNLATAAHVGGAALDVMLVDIKGRDIDMGAKYLESSTKTTTNSKQISKIAMKNRRILLKVTKKYGFANYPFEFWHFSQGDKIAARIQNKKFAIYGPVVYKKPNVPISFLSKEDQEKRFID
jgi:D-alanyl-D-alanine dipeptidase